jgi:dolichyl-phosphate beta-glucosyltransferase
MHLSYVIPAFNEERRIGPTLHAVWGYLRGQSFESEIIVSDDGSTDSTCEMVAAFSREAVGGPPVRMLRNPHLGKGGAVRAGMLAATGALRFCGDADQSMPVNQLDRFLAPESWAFDVAIGSREAPGAIRHDEPAYRHVMGRVFNAIVRLVAVPGLDDTQCGFKLFTADAAEALFSQQTMNGFGFDVEVLFLARKRGFTIVEIGIEWRHVESSKVQPVPDTIRMLRDCVLVRLNDWRGRYG